MANKQVKKNVRFIEEFPLKPKDILSSFDVFGMSSLEFGIYCKILFVSWIQRPIQCYLKFDEHNICELCKLTPEEWVLSKDRVIKKFALIYAEGVPYIYNERLLEIYNELVKTNKAAQGEQLTALGAIQNYSFDQFWEDYQKKVGDKRRLIPKWLKLSDADREAIRKNIPERIKAQPDKQFRPNPETYLNGRLWENEIVNYNKKAPNNWGNADYESQKDTAV